MCGSGVALVPRGDVRCPVPGPSHTSINSHSTPASLSVPRTLTQPLTSAIAVSRSTPHSPVFRWDRRPPLWPSPASSPWIRRYPHVGFSVARRTIRARRPAAMAGRPGRTGCVVQRRVISWRCQRRTVAGVTSSPRRRRTGEQSGEGGDQGAVGPGHSRARCAPLEHGELVAQDQDLEVLGDVGSGAQHDPAEELGEHLVDQWQRHQRIMQGTCRGRTSRSRAVHSFGHPHGPRSGGRGSTSGTHRPTSLASGAAVPFLKSGRPRETGSPHPCRCTRAVRAPRRPQRESRVAPSRRDTAPTGGRGLGGRTNRAGRAHAPAEADQPCPGPAETPPAQTRMSGTPRPGGDQQGQMT